MRKFSSYGPIKVDLHYHAPRTELIDQIYANQLQLSEIWLVLFVDAVNDEKH